MQTAKLGLAITKAEAATSLWSLALKKADFREELSKTRYVDVTSRLLEGGRPEEQHAAAGLLATMAKDAEFGCLSNLLANAMESRVSASIKRIWDPSWPHARSKVRCTLIRVHVWTP